MKDKKTGLDALFGIAEGLKEVVERLADAAENSEAFERQDGKGGIAGSYSVNVRFGGLNVDQGSGSGGSGSGSDSGRASKVKVEPHAPPPRERSQTAVGDEREPMVDVFDESDHILIVAEMPGADPGSVSVELSGDILVIGATGGGRRYSKEVLLPAAFAADKMSRSFNNGLLQIRLER